MWRQAAAGSAVSTAVVCPSGVGMRSNTTHIIECKQEDLAVCPRRDNCVLWVACSGKDKILQFFMMSSMEVVPAIHPLHQF